MTPANRTFKNKKYDMFEKDVEFEVRHIPSVTGQTIRQIVPKTTKPKNYYFPNLTFDDIEWEEPNTMNEQNEQPKMFTIAEVRELVGKAWEDGYTTSSEDSFHNKNTPYGKSDFFKEFYSKYNRG